MLCRRARQREVAALTCGLETMVCRRYCPAGLHSRVSRIPGPTAGCTACAPKPQRASFPVPDSHRPQGFGMSDSRWKCNFVAVCVEVTTSPKP